MVSKIQLQRILFLDIETVPTAVSFDSLNESEQLLFEKKTRYQRKNEIEPKEFYQKAGIWAEFGKVICISAGFFVKDKEELKFRIKSFYGDNECELLHSFKILLDTRYQSKNHLLCAHNGKEFDFPYLARRMIINGISLPEILNLFGKKPWEIRHLDTMEMWKFGDYKHYTSLQLLCKILEINSPKDDIDGGQVSRIYYKEKNLERIVRYCEKDTVSVAQIFLRFRNMKLLEENNIIGRLPAYSSLK